MGDIFEGLTTTDKIRGVLASRGKTQIDLANLLKLTPETISARMKFNKWEVSELNTIATEFGISATDLI